MVDDGSVFRVLGREVPRPAWVREHPQAAWAAVLAVCLGAFMGQLDASIVTLAFPDLQQEFRQGLGSVQWVSLAYLAVLAVLLVPVGRWSDARGRKLLYVNGFLVFTLASAACGLAPNLGWLVTARAVQAVGAAMLQANSVALVVRSVGPDRARAALGVQGAAQALGLATGPMLGGLLIDSFGWRSVFWVNVPVGVVAIVTAQLLLPRSRDLSTRTGSDPLGAALLATSVLGGLWVLTQLSGPGGSWPVLTGTLLGTAVGAALFWWVEGRAPAPLVSREDLHRAGVGIGLAGALLGYLVLFAPLVLYPLTFERWGLSPSRGGLVLTCLPLGFAVAAVLGARVGRHGTNATRIRLGAALAAVSAAAQALTWASPPAVAGLLLLTGASLGIAIPANNAVVMTAVPPSASAVTGGMINVARAVGTSLGVALTAIGVHAAQLRGWAPAPLVLGGLTVAALLLAVTAVKDRPPASGDTATVEAPPAL